MVQRKVKTTPLQREILWSLAENANESVLNIIVKLQTVFPKLSSKEILNEAALSIGILRRMGCLYVAGRIGAEIKWLQWEIVDSLVLNDLFEFDERDGSWQAKASDAFQGELILHLTQGGVIVLELIAQQSLTPTPVWKSKDNVSLG
ncbi:MAG TPA: hypothetical protein VF571_11115 [Pyrinomonadaceae bacterium]|jgi:hypothetical protein